MGHAAAVIGDTDIGGTTVAQADLDMRGPGVEAVLHQLLDHRGGAFHHLASSDAVD